jgi:hypothetical protein
MKPFLISSLLQLEGATFGNQIPSRLPINREPFTGLQRVASSRVHLPPVRVKFIGFIYYLHPVKD